VPDIDPKQFVRDTHKPVATSQESAEAVVAALLEADEPEAKLPKIRPEIRILPSHQSKEYFDVVLLSDGASLYIGTLGHRANYWKVVHTMSGVGRGDRAKLAFQTPTKEEAAINLVNVLKPYWGHLVEGETDPKKFVNDNFKYLYAVKRDENAWFNRGVIGGVNQMVTVAIFKNRQTALNYAANLGGKVYRVLDDSPIVKSFIIAGNRIQENADLEESSKASIEKEAAKAEKPASPEQAEAGNYKKGHVSVQGLEIAIENAKGSTRSGEDKDGKPWTVTLPAHYGYIKGTVGKDKDHLDVYLGDNPGGMVAFVVNQNKLEGGFDEHKILIGFKTKDEATQTYDKAFTGDLGPKLRASVVSTTVDKLKDWIASGNMKKPFENLSESLVNSLLENVDPKAMAMSLPRRNAFGDMAVGAVFQDGEGGAVFQIVDKFYDSAGGARPSYVDMNGKHVDGYSTGMAVRYIEYSPAYAYGKYTRQYTAAAEEPFHDGIIYLGNAKDWPPERIWKYVTEVAQRNRDSSAEDFDRRHPGQPNPFRRE
jgi:hypothetical protein